MKKLLTFTLLLTGIASALPLHADILRIDQNTLQGKVVNADNAPRRGMSKAAVVKKYGPPIERKGAVGNPPISSWTYPGYRIYFEHDHVIHSVTQ